MPCTPPDAVAAIYGCVPDPACWPEALQRVADSLGDIGGLLIHHGADGGFKMLASPGLRGASGLDERFCWPHDLRAERALAHPCAAAGDGAATDRPAAPREEIRVHPVDPRVVSAPGLRWAASIDVSPRDDVQVELSVLRAAGRSPFADRELGALAALGRHVGQALRLGLRLAEAEAVSSGLGDALSRLASGVFVVDGARRLLFANRRGRQLTGTVFAVRDGLLGCRAPACDRRLTALLRVAHGGRGFRPSPLVLEAAEVRSAVYVLPLGFEAAAFAAAAGPCAALLAIDLAPGEPLDAGLVRDVYGLTLAEARVAALVGAGIPPRETAAKLHLAEETVRSVLKRVFSKLDVSRQAELTELFTRLKAVQPTV